MKMLFISMIVVSILGHIGGQPHELLYLPLGEGLPISVGQECDFRLLRDHDFKRCRERAIDSWYTNDDSYRLKYMCCYNWDIFDCMDYAIQNLCSFQTSSLEYKNFLLRKEEWISYYEGYQCVDYKYGSAKCHFPGWAIALIIIAGLLLVGGAGFVIFLYRKNRL